MPFSKGRGKKLSDDPGLEFCCLLAGHLKKSIGEILALPAAEVAVWEAYYRRHPWGDWRADLRMGILASSVATIVSGFGNRRGRRFKAKDFMPKFGQSDQKAKPTSLGDKLKARFQLLGVDFSKKGVQKLRGDR